MDEFVQRIIASFAPSPDKNKIAAELVSYITGNLNEVIPYFIEIFTNPEIRAKFNIIHFQNALNLSTIFCPKTFSQRTENPFENVNPELVKGLFEALVHIVIENPKTTGSIASLSVSRLVRSDINFGSFFGFEADILRLFFEPINPEAQANVTLLLQLVVELTELDNETAGNIILKIREISQTEQDSYLLSQLVNLLSKVIEFTDVMSAGTEQSDVVFELLMNFTGNGETKKATYCIWSDVINDYYPLVKNVSDALMQMSIADINAEGQESNTVNNILDLWIEIAKNEASGEANLGIIEKFSSEIIPTITRIASMVSSEDCLTTEENEPNITASRLIKKVMKLKIGHPLFVEIMDNFMKSENIGERECALTIIASFLSYGDANELLDAILAHTLTELGSEAQRVRENAVFVVYDLVEIVCGTRTSTVAAQKEKIAEFLMSALEQIAVIMENDSKTAATAARTLIEYLNIPGFTEAEPLIIRILSAAENENNEVAREAIKSLNILCSQQSAEVVASVLPNVLKLLEEKCSVEAETDILIIELLDDLPNFFKKLKGVLDDEEVIGKAWEILVAISENENLVEHILLPVVSLAVAVGEEFSDKIEDIMELIIKCFQDLQEPSRVKMASMAICWLSGTFDIEFASPQLLEIASSSLKEAPDIETKAYIVRVIRDAINAAPQVFLENAEEIVTPLLEAAGEFDQIRKSQERKYTTKEDVQETQIQASYFLQALIAVINAFVAGETDISELLPALLEMFLSIAGLPFICNEDFAFEIIECGYIFLTHFADETKEALSACDGLLQSIRISSEKHINEDKAKEITQFFAS